MTLNAESLDVNEVKSENLDKRFVCQADIRDFSVELVVQCKGSTDQGVLTVWNDMDLITNNKEVDVDLEMRTVEGVMDFFETFVIGDVQTYLKKKK